MVYTVDASEHIFDKCYKEPEFPFKRGKHNRKNWIHNTKDDSQWEYLDISSENSYLITNLQKMRFEQNQSHCACGEYIVDTHLIFNKETGVCLPCGSKCIKRFMKKDYSSSTKCIECRDVKARTPLGYCKKCLGYLNTQDTNTEYIVVDQEDERKKIKALYTKSFKSLPSIESFKFNQLCKDYLNERQEMIDIFLLNLDRLKIRITQFINRMSYPPVHKCFRIMKTAHRKPRFNTDMIESCIRSWGKSGFLTSRQKDAVNNTFIKWRF